MPESLTDALARASGRPAQWSAVADGWARRRAYVWEVSREVGQRLVDALAPQPGETVLELAAGPGDTGFLAAPRLQPGGRLLSTDVAPEMVEAARARAAELGLSNVEHLLVDAQAIPLADASVDAVLCRWGYMLVPDPALALAETRRVLRPGGRVAFAVWAEARENPWGTAVGKALLERGHIERPDPDAPGPFRLGERARVRELVLAAGFAEPAFEEVAVTWRYESFEDYWQVTADLSFLLRTALGLLGEEELAHVRALAQEALAGYADGRGRLAVPGLCRNVVARAPDA
ncbi:MAG TPA: methyltransferase domain-containing protein [Gaiellaceae bacterium]|nr:methyltransferase domain-containing protein [Gaiellaceae bacterium]